MGSGGFVRFFIKSVKVFLGFEQAFHVLHRVFRVNFCGGLCGWKGSEICFTGVQGRDLIIGDLSFSAFRVQMAGGFWFASKGLEVCVLALFLLVEGAEKGFHG